MGVTGGSPIGFDVGAPEAYGTLPGLDLVCAFCDYRRAAYKHRFARLARAFTLSVVFMGSSWEQICLRIQVLSRVS